MEKKMKFAAVALLFMLALPVQAAELTSEYTRNDPANDCEILDQSAPDEGDWSDIVCPGVRGYSYYISGADGREAVTYGFAGEPGMPTFGAFNYAHSTVEWRLGRLNGKTVPLAAIQRFYLADGNGEWTTQILVVSKVGQPDGGGACVMGYVSANEGSSANLRAREISNGASSFRCGRDAPVIETKIRRHVPSF
jgi:hypothetical protein